MFGYPRYYIEVKLDGFHLWKKKSLFKTEEIMTGGDKDDLLDKLIDEKFEMPFKKINASEVVKYVKKEYGDGAYYKTHIERCKESAAKENKKFGYGTYEDFIAEFTKIQLADGWARDKSFEESFFGREERGRNQIHASLIVFDDVYMIMKTTKDYIKFNRWVKDNIMTFESKGLEVKKWG